MENTLEDLYNRYTGNSDPLPSPSILKGEIDGIDELASRDANGKPFKLPKKPPFKVETVTLDTLLGWLVRAGMVLSSDGTGGITVTHPEPEAIPDWLVKAVTVHNLALSKLVAYRIAFKAIEDRITRLRFENPPKGTREAAFAYIDQQIRKLAGACDLPDGYTDPSDPFADGAVSMLWHEYEELTANGNPYPIPADDPRERYPNGKLM